MKGICFRMTVITPILEMIKQAHGVAVKDENRQSKRIIGQISAFSIDSRGLLNFHGRIWVHTQEELDKY